MLIPAKVKKKKKGKLKIQNIFKENIPWANT